MRRTILDIQKYKESGRRLPMLTAYDAATARLVEAAGIPMILVGDSLGMVVQGHETTIPVTLEEMIYHTRAVVRGTRQALIVADMPFMTYPVSPEQALTNAAKLFQQGGAGAVKVEGGESIAPTVARIVNAGMPVMAHIGLTPQSVHQLGGWRVQGRAVEAARRLLDSALALEAAGAFAIVLEAIPAPLAAFITKRLHIPTIGIGAGAGCDGQVQVFHDVVGLIEDFLPKHAKRYLNLAHSIREAIGHYAEDVENGAFPTAANAFGMDESILSQLEDQPEPEPPPPPSEPPPAPEPTEVAEEAASYTPIDDDDGNDDADADARADDNADDNAEVYADDSGEEADYPDGYTAADTEEGEIDGRTDDD